MSQRATCRDCRWGSLSDLAPGSVKTDKRDAQAIAQAAHTMPHTLRAVSTSDEDTAALSMLTGFDLDLARQVNIRGQCAPRPRPGEGSGAALGT